MHFRLFGEGGICNGGQALEAMDAGYGRKGKAVGERRKVKP